MKIAVWGTCVNRTDGVGVMHFDILVNRKLTDAIKVFDFGKKFLKEKSIKNEEWTSKECSFCHIENASELVIEAIRRKGYYIIELENCN